MVYENKIKKVTIAITVFILLPLTIIGVFPHAASAVEYLQSWEEKWERLVIYSDAIVIADTVDMYQVHDSVDGYYNLYQLEIETVIKGDDSLENTGINAHYHSYSYAEIPEGSIYRTNEPIYKSIFCLYKENDTYFISYEQHIDPMDQNNMGLWRLNVANEAFRIMYCMEKNNIPVQIQPSDSPMPLTELVTDSTCVLTGSVTFIEQGINRRRQSVLVKGSEILWAISVDKVLKGEPDAELIVRADDGPVDDIESWLWDVPHLEESDRVLLFLEKGADGCYSVVGGQRSVLYLESDWYEPVENQSDVICNIVSVMRENDIPVVLSRKDLAECRSLFPVWAIVAIVCGCCLVTGILVWRLRYRRNRML